jgi:hypothetical protein
MAEENSSSNDLSYPTVEKGSPLRIVFMGTPEFAVASLHALVSAGYSIVGVITAPDKPGGRGMKLQESAVKKYATEKGLYILQPEKLKNPAFLESPEITTGRCAGGGSLSYAARSGMEHAAFRNHQCSRLFVTAIPRRSTY